MSAARFAIASRLLKRLAATCAAALAVVGCAKPPAETSAQAIVLTEAPPDQELQWEERPLGGIASRGAELTVVRSGPSPLVYLVESPQVVRVVDESSRSVMAEVAVAAQKIVRIDDRNGVIAGGEMLVPGPLPPGRRYSIVVVPDQENVSRTGTFRPRPVDDPAGE